jgi:hypothetical protein
MKAAIKQTTYIYDITIFFIVLFSIFSRIIPSLEAAPSCNSFPKIFGGGIGDTSIFQMDVFNDNLAFGGESFDTSLTGLTTPV